MITKLPERIQWRSCGDVKLNNSAFNVPAKAVIVPAMAKAAQT